MKQLQRITALLLTGALCAGMAGCGKEEAPPYEKIVSKYVQALMDEDEDELLKVLGSRLYKESVTEIFNEEPEFYQAMGYEDADEYARESYTLWFDSVTHNMKKFTYSIDLVTEVDTAQLASIVPSAQRCAGADEIYDISLYCETKDDETRELLRQVEDFYAVRDGEDWYIVLPTLTLIEKPWLRPAYNYLNAIQQNDLTLLTEDESLKLFMDSYTETLEQMLYMLIDAGIYDDWRQALYYLEVDTIQEYALQTLEESFQDGSAGYGEFTFTFGDVTLLEDDALDEALEESILGELDMIPDVDEAYDIEIVTGALASGDIPSRMVVAYVDTSWQLLFAE